MQHLQPLHQIPLSSSTCHRCGGGGCWNLDRQVGREVVKKKHWGLETHLRLESIVCRHRRPGIGV